MRNLTSAIMTSVLLAALPAPAFAQSASTAITITLPGHGTISETSYVCAGSDDPYIVRYINGPPNFLVLLLVDEGPLLMASTPSDDGLRYTAGPYAWLTKGIQGTLTDQRFGTEPMLTCAEATDTP